MRAVIWQLLNLSRRQLLGALACFAVGGTRALGETGAPWGLEIDSLWPAEAWAGEERGEMRYRVDAVVLLFSLPVFRRAAVGEARVAIKQQAGAGGRRLAIEFAAASDPARAHGIDRAGCFREVVLERNGAPDRAASLGVMNDSPEQTVEQARSAFRSGPEDPRFVAIDSSSAPGRTRSRVVHFHQPRSEPVAGESWAEGVRQRFQHEPPRWKQTEWAGTEGRAPGTFLYALLRALEQPGGRTRSLYVFNENRYLLETESAPDPERGKQFAAARLTASADRIVRVRGRIENLTLRLRPAHVQLWIDTNSAIPLPVRIEFEPRSFLRLAMEAPPSVPAAAKEQV